MGSAHDDMLWYGQLEIERLTERNRVLEIAHRQMNASLDKSYAEIERLRSVVMQYETLRPELPQIAFKD